MAEVPATPEQNRWYACLYPSPPKPPPAYQTVRCPSCGRKPLRLPVGASVLEGDTCGACLEADFPAEDGEQDEGQIDHSPDDEVPRLPAPEDGEE
jgi:hypothetical protein